MERFQEVLDQLKPLPKIKPKEIRIVIKGGLIQGMEVGSEVPKNIVVNSIDLDTETMGYDDMIERCHITEDHDPCIFDSVDES